jgi:GT2 family glycosyltransferase
MRRIYFICVNFNNAEITIKYIQSILSLKNEKWFNIFIIIVDNKSSNAEIGKLAEYLLDYPEIHLIRNERNLGYFGGLNSGIENIDISATEFIVIGNNDIEFKSDFIHELYIMREISKDIYVLAPNIVNLDGEHQNPVSIKRLSFYRRLWLDVYHLNYYIGIPLYFLIERFRKKSTQSSKQQLVDKIPITLGYGACYILSKSFFMQFSKLDDSVFLYGEEALLSNQVKSVGGIIMFCPNLIVRHSEHRSISKVEPKALYKVKKKAYKQYKDFL